MFNVAFIDEDSSVVAFQSETRIPRSVHRHKESKSSSLSPVCHLLMAITTRELHGGHVKLKCTKQVLSET